MPSMRDHFDIYEELRDLSSHMVAAARSNDWQRLVAMERRVATLRDEMIAHPGNAGAAMNAPEIDRKRGLIRQILDDDAEIRRHTEPWMEQVREFLSGQSRRRKVLVAYAATDGGLGVETANGLRV